MYLLLLIVVVVAVVLYCSVPIQKTNADTFVPTLPSTAVTTPLLDIWNGSYPYSGTQPGNNDYLEIRMKDQDNGIVTAGNNHWIVRSYGPQIISGDSYDKTNTIHIEMLGDWRHAQERLPRIRAHITDNNTSQMRSLNSNNPLNLNAYSIKIFPQ